jgi:flagellar biosynthesis protein FlhG
LDLIDNFRELVSRNLEVQLGSLGLVYQDSAVRRSLKNLNPVTVNNADSVVTREIDRFAQKILQSPRFPTMPLDYSEYSDSFELTRIEAENDYADVSGEQEQGELGVSNEEFLSIIAMQKKQIEELRGTVRMLTMNQR